MRTCSLGSHPPYLCVTVKGQSEIHKEPTPTWCGSLVQTGDGKLVCLWAKSGPLPMFISKILLEHHHPHPLTCYLRLFCTAMQSWVVIREIACPLMSKIFFTWTFKEKKKIIDLCSKPRAGSLSDSVLRSLSHSFLVMGEKKKLRSSQAVEWGSLSKFTKMGRSDWRWWWLLQGTPKLVLQMVSVVYRGQLRG